MKYQLKKIILEYEAQRKTGEYPEDCAIAAGWSLTESTEEYVAGPVNESAEDLAADIRAISSIACFEKISGPIKESAVGIRFEFDEWSVDHYIVLPAAVYAGNRFEAREMGYLPRLLDPADIGPDKPVILSDVPRLSLHEGPSRIQQLVGDLATPAVGIWSPEEKKSLWILWEPQGEVRTGERIYTGLSLEENADRTKMTLDIMLPGMREGYRYKISNTKMPSQDVGLQFAPGDTASLTYSILEQPAESIPELFRQYAEILGEDFGRTDDGVPCSVIRNRFLKNELPYSTAFAIQEEKYNRDNWEAEHGYYSIGIRDVITQDWQIGWVGGLLNTYPLLLLGNEETKKRVYSTFDFVFPEGIAPSGLFWDSSHEGIWYGDDCLKENSKNWHLIRKSGDAAYFMLKTFAYLCLSGREEEIKPAWVEGTLRVVDSICNLWIKHGQFGQFVDSITGDIIVGGSTSGASATAALALATKMLAEPGILKVLTGGSRNERPEQRGAQWDVPATEVLAEKCRKTAAESGTHFYKEFICKGYTCGGPGDAMQNIDSESGYAVINAFVELYELTGDSVWIIRAEDAANLYSSWVLSYPYEFPAESEFGRLGINPYGAVFANIQNKHGAPGICSDSGFSLFKLYRLTGKRYYLRLLEATAHNITQYLSRKDRPIMGMSSGWMNERVNTSDWLEPVGNIFCGTTWAEIACMLSIAELPGVYVDKEIGNAAVFDNVEVSVTKGDLAVDNSIWYLTITNPTEFDAQVSLLVEGKEEKSKRLEFGESLKWKKVLVKKGETVQVQS